METGGGFLNRQKLSKLILEDRQQKAVEKIISEATKATLNASLMGTGKTLMAVESAIKLGAKTNLIIGPLNTYWGWWDTIQRQTDYASTITKIDSTKSGKEALANLAGGIPGWYFVGREYFRRLDWSKIVPDMAMVDECHFAQNRNSKSFRAL
jgi:hypothetical protein